MIFKLAFRNLLRNPRRTFLTASAIAFGLMWVILIDSMLSGIDKDSFDRIINYETGHVKILSKGYYENREDLPLDRSITAPAPIEKALRSDSRVEAVTPRMNFRLMLSDGIDQIPAVGIAVDPTADATVFGLRQSVEKGSFLSGSEEAMLIGKGLADDFGVGVGDMLTIVARTKYETMQALDLRIKGIIETEDPKIDWLSIVIPLGLAQRSLDMGQAVTEVDIKLKDPAATEKFARSLGKRLPGLEVMTWKELSEDVIAISETKRSVSFFMFLSVTLVALIGITNTILLGAFERVKEVGMMSAMGMKRGQIVRLFVLEGAMIGAIGSLIGCAAGILANIPMVNYGIGWGFLMRDMGIAGYRITGTSYGIWNPAMIIATFMAGTIISAIVSIYPARVASCMEPTEALRKG